MVERFKAHAWKACVVKATAGSNPVLSANLRDDTGKRPARLFFLCSKTRTMK